MKVNIKEFRNFIQETKLIEDIINSQLKWENVLTEETIKDLIDNMSPDYREISKYNKDSVTISNFKEYYYAGTKLLKFYANTKSNSGSGKVYSSSIIFGKVDYVETDPKNKNWKPYTIIDKQGNRFDVWYEIPKIGTNPVKLDCTCPDFRWRFTIKNKSNDYLNGVVPKFVKNYKKKTDRPSQQHVGLCKHTYYMIQYLIQNNYLRR